MGPTEASPEVLEVTRPVLPPPMSQSLGDRASQHPLCACGHGPCLFGDVRAERPWPVAGPWGAAVDISWKVYVWSAEDKHRIKETNGKASVQEWEGLPSAGVDGQVAARRAECGPNTWLGTGHRG